MLASVTTKPPTARTGRMRPSYEAESGNTIRRPDARYHLRLLTPSALQLEIQRSPIRTLQALRAIHPTLSQADDNDLGLLNQPGDIRVVAVLPGSPGSEDDETDDALTEQLDALWDTLPNGLMGLVDDLLMDVEYTGMCALRGLVSENGRELLGVEALKPTEILFTADTERPGSYHAWHRRESGADIGWEWLDPETAFTASLSGGTGNPYGMARRAPALWEIYNDLRLNNDMRDMFHFAAMPRVALKIDHAQLLEYGRQRFPGYTEEELTEWLQGEVDALSAAVDGLRADDYILTDISAVVEMLEGGKGLGNQDKYLDWFQRRLVQSIGTQPFMVGVNDTTTETQAREQFKLQAMVLERVRACAMEVIRKTANLYLRLIGSMAVAHVEYRAIRTTDALIEAQTASMELATAGQRAVMGIDSMDTVSQDVTGSGLADPEQAERWVAAQLKVGGNPAGNSTAPTLDAIEATKRRRRERRGQTQDAETQEQQAEGEGA